jgi:NAD(P)-dependent dehydrogenase (short-subunit alcohol dehydrogenase family)
VLLQGRRIAITGASRGLGRAFAIACAEQGASVVVNGTNAELLDGVVATIKAAGGRAEPVVGSVAEEAVADAIVARTVAAFGGIDVLVNNAGIVRDRTLMKMTVEEFDEVIAVNLRGTWLCARAAARAMAESGGHILNVTSNSGLSGGIGQTNYAASKAGVVGMTRTWRRELARYGIRTNAIWPLAHTDMTQVVVDRVAAAAEAKGDQAPTPGEIGLGDPAEVAKLVVYLCSDAAAHIDGQVLSSDGRRICLWSHPHETDVGRQDSWTIEELAAALAPNGGVEFATLNAR